jgi:hypothetical protein
MFSTRKKNAYTLIEFHLSAPVEYTTNLTQKIVLIFSLHIAQSTNQSRVCAQVSIFKANLFLGFVKQIQQFSGTFVPPDLEPTVQKI